MKIKDSVSFYISMICASLIAGCIVLSMLIPINIYVKEVPARVIYVNKIDGTIYCEGTDFAKELNCDSKLLFNLNKKDIVRVRCTESTYKFCWFIGGIRKMEYEVMNKEINYD